MTLNAAVDLATSEPVLFGDERGLRGLIDLLRRGETVALELGEAARRPVFRGLAEIRIVPGAGPIVLDVDESRLEIRGAPECLASMADEMELHLEHNDIDEPGFHFHVASSWSPPGGPSSSPGRESGLIVAGLVPDD